MSSRQVSSPARSFIALVLLLCLSIIALSPALRSGNAHAAPAKAAAVLLGSSTVASGGTVKVTATGFSPSEAVRFELATTGSVSTTVPLSSSTAGPTGTLVIQNEPIPATVPAGAYLLRGIGTTSHMTAEAKLAVTAAAKPDIVVKPTTFGPGDTATISGTGFMAGETVQINLSTSSGTTSLVLGTATATASGAFGPKAVHIPYGVTPGKLQIVVTGLKSNRQAIQAVTVNVTPASVSVSPASAKPAEKVAISGTHFEPGEVVTVDLVALSTSARLAVARAGANGAFTLNSVIIPKNTPEGIVSVVATGLKSHLSATTQIKILAVAATLTVAPNPVTAGNTVHLQGTNFIPGETVTIQLTGGKLPAVTLGNVIANTSGSIGVAKLVIPSFLPSARYTLTAFGQTSGRSSSVALDVKAPAAGPELSIIDPGHFAGTPYRLSPGGLAQIAGAHFPAGAKVTLELAGASGSITLVQVTASSAGGIGPLGVTIPANTAAGAYTLKAVVGGSALASVKTVVAALAPHLALSTYTLVPGKTVSISGSGFAPGEQVVVALNGAALLTSPASILASGAGAFSVSFVVPATVNDGANLITAGGVSSRASASVRATANLPVATRWYFPQGDTTGDTRTQISILNPGAALATIKMTFLYANGPEHHYTTTVAAHSQASVGLSLVAGSGRHVSTILESDRQVSAESTTTYGGGDSTTALGATGPSTLWYLAEGYTNGSFREFIHVMNPNSTFATIDVRFLPFNNRPAREVRFVMQPRANVQIDAGTYMPGLSISTIVTSDKGVVVERSMRFGANGRGAHDKIGVTSASTVWLFAEGESAANRQTFFTILNPNQAAPAAITATFFDRAGKPIGAKTIVVDPLHRGNIKLNDVLPAAQVATILTSNVPVVVERPLYQGPANLAAAPSGSVIFGLNGGGLSWAFPGASNANGDQTQMYLFNPGLKPAQIRATFYGDDGSTVNQDYTLAPNSVSIVNANSVPGLHTGGFGTVLKSTNGQVFLAEVDVLNPTLQRASSIQGVSQ
ncbi:MAG: hypothetical protein JWO42_3289 [Chloroflexi bacterium]|nr:hypothetical protein [Chloroflexota bacterium]